MLLDQIFTPFLAESPLSVMARATVEHALTAASLDQLFQQHAQTQYTRDLLFSSVVDLMSLVVTNVQRSVSAAYQTGLRRARRRPPAWPGGPAVVAGRWPAA